LEIDPYEMKRRGMLYYPPKGMALLAVMQDGFRRAGIRELVKNEHVANRTCRIAKYPQIGDL